MKTINPNVETFKTLVQAKKNYDKLTTGSLLIHAGTYYVDKCSVYNDDSIYKSWPKLYAIIYSKENNIDIEL